MGQKISKEQRDRFLAAWDRAVHGRFSSEVTVRNYWTILDSLEEAAEPIGIVLMYPGQVAQGF